MFAGFVAFDFLVHGWDIAVGSRLVLRPAGRPRARLSPRSPGRLSAPELRDGETFAAVTEAPAGGGALERFVAFSGRSL